MIDHVVGNGVLIQIVSMARKERDKMKQRKVYWFGPFDYVIYEVIEG
jgi:hypothetical protein